MSKVDTTRIYNKSSTKLTQAEIDAVVERINTMLSPPSTQELIMSIPGPENKQVKAIIMTVIRLVNLEDV